MLRSGGVKDIGKTNSDVCNLELYVKHNSNAGNEELWRPRQDNLGRLYFGRSNNARQVMEFQVKRNSNAGMRTCRDRTITWQSTTLLFRAPSLATKVQLKHNPLAEVRRCGD